MGGIIKNYENICNKQKIRNRLRMEENKKCFQARGDITQGWSRGREGRDLLSEQNLGIV